MGVELFLGKVADITAPGLNYNWPAPIGATFTPQVLAVREVTIGARDVQSGNRVGRSARRWKKPDGDGRRETSSTSISACSGTSRPSRAHGGGGLLVQTSRIRKGTVRAVAESAMR